MTTTNAPNRVQDHRQYWTSPPPEQSARCTYWVERIKGGWKPNRRIAGMGYDEEAEYFGVYIWELFEVLRPLMRPNDPPLNFS